MRKGNIIVVAEDDEELTADINAARKAPTIKHYIHENKFYSLLTDIIILTWLF
jgi:hypothetical protein